MRAFGARHIPLWLLGLLLASLFFMSNYPCSSDPSLNSCSKVYERRQNLASHRKSCEYFARYIEGRQEKLRQKGSLPGALKKGTGLATRKTRLKSSLGSRLDYSNDTSAFNSGHGASSDWEMGTSSQGSLPPRTTSPDLDPMPVDETPSQPDLSPSRTVHSGPSGRPSRQHPTPDDIRDPIPGDSEDSDSSDEEQDPQSPSQPTFSWIRRVYLIVRDNFRTKVLRPFGLYRFYPHRPSYVPDEVRGLLVTDLSAPPPSALENDPSANSSPYKPPWPFPNMSAWHFMNWHLSPTSSIKSEASSNEMLRLFREPDFKQEELLEFSVDKGNKCLDMPLPESATEKLPFLEKFRETTVKIQIPTGSANSEPAEFSVPGLLHRSLVSVIREAFTGPDGAHIHYSPFKLFQKITESNDPDSPEQRIFQELYNSDAFLKEDDHLKRHGVNPPDDPDCKLEKVVAALMYLSDGTHLANFGTAKAWPIYLMLGNISKYIRGVLNSGALHHVAYIPSLPDDFKDFASQEHTKWKTQHADILTHARRELMHAIWSILLDDDFLHAYKYGIVIKCYDGVLRRVYPRIFTYSADYPEKVLLATIRGNKSLFPCPRCFIHHSKLDQMGTHNDMTSRVRKIRTYLSRMVEIARDAIYRKGEPITGKRVDDCLKDSSSVPIENAFIKRLRTIEVDFDPFQILVPDFMHEFELGIWKALFTHLIRILYAVGPGDAMVVELDRRYRLISSFGLSTIRRFANNASEMKKLAARDFEDLLQCSIPVFEGLLPDEEDNKLLMTLLFRLAEFHAFCKMRMHSDTTLDHLEALTKEVGRLMRKFRGTTCQKYSGTVELPREAAARGRRQAQKATESERQSKTPAATSTRKKRDLNLFTYKYHSLGDYVRAIRLFGTLDGFSTQIGELAHRLLKRWYPLTNKKNAMKQIAKRYTRLETLRRVADARKRQSIKEKIISQRKGTSNETRVFTALESNVPSLNDDYSMSLSRNNYIDVTTFERTSKDPAAKKFYPKLQDHLLGRLLGREFDGDDHKDFSPEERNKISIVNNRAYQVAILHANYTTYDLRRESDSINPRNHCFVMVHSPEVSTDNSAHPFWYARVIGIFHAVVRFQSAAGLEEHGMNFLWVRWLGVEPSYRSGFKSARLPKIGYVPELDSFAFGFLDPSHVIRGCHLIPDFALGRTSSLLSTTQATAARDPDEKDDWWDLYVDIFVDRDMVMRYFGGGVGHIQRLASEAGILSETEDDESDSDDGISHPDPIASLSDSDDGSVDAGLSSDSDGRESEADLDDTGFEDF